jgi:hypothetical protein
MYNITIDFTKEKIFEKNNQQYLNMAKSFNVNKNNTVQSDSVKDEVRMICDHIFIVWCSKNIQLYEWILNFISRTFCGKKITKSDIFTM